MATRNAKIGDIDQGSADQVVESCTDCFQKNTQSQPVKYCLTCKDYLCIACFITHKRNRSRHVIVEYTDQKKMRELISAVTCHDHPGKIIDMICQTHDEVGCETCMETKHSW